MSWTSAIRTSPDLVIPPAVFRTLVAHALGIPLPGFHNIQHRRCLCGTSLGYEGHHLLSCYRTYAHDNAVRVIHEMCRAAKLVSEVEPTGLLLGEHRPDLSIPNLRADGRTYLADFASVDPTRLSSIQAAWFTVGHAASQRDQEKRDAYVGIYNPTAYAVLPLVMETTGRMHHGLRQFVSEVAAFASKHLPRGGIGEKRFRSRFMQYWKAKVVVTFLKCLAKSAIHTYEAIVDRSVQNRHSTNFIDIF